MLSEFNAVLDLVEQIVEKLDVDENKDQVAVVQYSKEPSVDFFLNTHRTKQSIAENVRNLRPKGGSPLNIGAALSYVTDNIFTVSSGSRRQRGVSQVLLLVIGGRSSDDIRNAVEDLKAMGVRVFVVAMKNADILEVEMISQESGGAFLSADSSNLSDIEQQILSATARIENILTKSTSFGKILLVGSLFG